MADEPLIGVIVQSAGEGFLEAVREGITLRDLFLIYHLESPRLDDALFPPA